MIEHKTHFVKPQVSVMRPIRNQTIGLFGAPLYAGLAILYPNSNNCKNRLKVLEIPPVGRITDKARTFQIQTKKVEFNIRGWG
jgi:hypothetical protein